MEILGFLLGVLTPSNFMLALTGVVLGTAIGALPGLSATMAVAVLVPFTFVLGPASGLIALGAIYTGALYGGAFAAILVNTPGTPSSIATTFDGYPMARKGDGGLAISIATLASVFGGIVGAMALLLVSPPLAKIALAFGPAEYFWLAIFGLTLISALSVGNTLKGLMGACIGLLLSMVGVAVIGGDVRYTFGMQNLLGGIDITAALIGLYCVPVMIDLVMRQDPHIQVAEEKDGMRLGDALRLVLKGKFNLLRSSVIGTIVGILPGAGGSIAGLVAYTEARRASAHPEEFGKGAPDGVIATEAANNATVGGGFIPTLVLGIPGTPPDAIILGALLVQGVKVGPSLFTADAPIVYTFIFGLLLATLLMLPAGLFIGRYAYRFITRFPKSLLVPSIAFMTIAGAYAVHSSIHDVQVMIVLGLVGWVLDRYGIRPSPIVLGLVLGSIAEQGFVQSYLIGNSSGNVIGIFFGRPISIGIILAAALTITFPHWANYRKKRADAAITASEAQVPRAAETQSAARVDTRIGTVAVALTCLAMAGVGLVQARGMTAMGAVFPRTIATVLALLSVLMLIRIARAWMTGAPDDRAPISADASAVRGWLFTLASLLWVWLIPVVGFATTAIAAFAVLMPVAEFGRASLRTWLLRSLFALLMIGGFWVLMARVLLLRMPAGLLF
ncbi:MAG: tripartite tricarboxylate transporter permease [Roseovarius indicus]